MAKKPGREHSKKLINGIQALSEMSGEMNILRDNKK
jgi:hypothetical protein